jgi:DNA-binding response OmpR family regulator
MDILIADDDPIYRRLIESALQDQGHSVVIARNGLEAWQILQRNDPPRLAILDWMMPEMDGIDICRKAKKLDRLKDIYIIIATSRSFKEDITAGMIVGADDYIIKPFEREELFRSVEAGIQAIELQVKQDV